jgi:hypothetical protein
MADDAENVKEWSVGLRTVSSVQMTRNALNERHQSTRGHCHHEVRTMINFANLNNW